MAREKVSSFLDSSNQLKKKEENEDGTREIKKYGRSQNLWGGGGEGHPKGEESMGGKGL